MLNFKFKIRARWRMSQCKYSDELEMVQDLIKCYYLGKIKIWTKVIDQEVVPSFAWIQRSTLGETSWRSKFSPKYF